MAEQQEWLGIYTAGSAGKPVVLVAAGGPVREIRRVFAGQPVQIAAVEFTATENPDITALYEQPEVEDQPDTAQASDDVLKAQIRTELLEEERRKTLTDEVKRELAAEKKAVKETAKETAD